MTKTMHPPRPAESLESPYVSFATSTSDSAPPPRCCSFVAAAKVVLSLATLLVAGLGIAGAQTATSSQSRPSLTTLTRELNGGSFRSIGNLSFLLANATTAFYDAQGQKNFVIATDGTTTGTHVLGERRSFYGISDDGVAFWTAFDHADGSTLWRSDGTPGGTLSSLLPLRQLRPGGDVGFPTDAGAIIGSHLVMVLCDFDGCGLAAIDPESLEPTFLADTRGRFDREAYFLGRVGDDLLFNASSRRDSRTREVQIWRTDGTTAGTAPVAQIPGHMEGAGQLATTERLFFEVLLNEPTTPDITQLWATNGTPEGTVNVAEISSDSPFEPHFSLLAGAQGTVYFRAAQLEDGALLRSRGQPGDAVPVFEFPVGSGVSDMAILDDGTTLLLTATDEDYELFRVGESLEELTLLTESSGLVVGRRLHSLGSRVVFHVGHGFGGAEAADLMSSDGTRGGTGAFRSYDCLTETCPRELRRALTGPPRLAYFSIPFLDGGGELWSTDGTSAGTTLFIEKNQLSVGAGAHLINGAVFDGRDLRSGETQLWGLGLRQRQPTRLSSLTVPFGRDRLDPAGGARRVANRIVFPMPKAPEGATRLWSTDGSADGTSVLPAPQSLSDVSWFETDESDVIFFVDRQTFESSLWRTDGTPDGTFRIHDDVSVVGPVVGDELYFRSEAAVGLWKTDGSLSGTTRVSDSFLMSSLNFLVDDRICYLRSQSRADVECFNTTTQATTTTEDTVLGSPFASIGNLVLFAERGALMRVDAETFANPVTVAALPGLSARSLIATEHDGFVYVAVSDYPSRFDLVRMSPDGTGAENLGSFVGGGSGGTGLEFVSAPHGLYFIGNSRSEGYEVWRTLGSRSSTEVAVDLVPGEASSFPANLVATETGLIFSAHTNTTGYEQFFFDAATGEAHLLQDLVPGFLGSRPGRAATTEDFGVFVAEDGLRGPQAHAIRLNPSGCIASEGAICLSGERFKVEAVWRDFDGNFGSGNAVPLTDDTGYFWFFDQDNVENVLKVLDARGVNEHFWVFFGALSNVEYWLTVTDTSTGLAKRYFNPPGTFASAGDTEAFGPAGVPFPEAVVTNSGFHRVEGVESRGSAGACVENETTVCLNGDRFGVSVDWTDFQGSTGTGTPSAVTDDTGTVWFFDEANVEVIFKILDASAVNGHFWFFYGALSNVAYTITVTDHQTGVTKTYSNPSGRFASAGDVEAFDAL